MTAWKRLLVLGSATTMLGACMHHNASYTGVSNGDVTVDSLSATRTALLRVDNNLGQDVRVYMIMPGMKPNYVAKALSGQVRTWVLDPSMFPANSVSFEVRPADGSPSRTFGPYTVRKNETVEMVLPSDWMSSHAAVHRSTP